MTPRTPNRASTPAWLPRLRNAFAAGCSAAMAAAIAMTAVHHSRPDVRLGMDRELPRGVSGFYPAERQGKTGFSWTSGRARLEFALLDRRVPWTCKAEVINWRPPAAGPARVQIRSGGVLLLDRQVSEPTAELEFAVPADPARSGIDVSIDVSPTFRPGPQDSRELGLAFDAFSCAPGEGAAPRLAASVLARGSAAAALAGIVIGLSGLPLLAALGAGAGLAAAQAWSLASGGAAQSLTSPPVFPLAGLFALFCLLPVAVSAAVLCRPLSTPARLAVVVSACAFYLKLIFLLHPDKHLVDALFHAHRFERVLAGHLYFTQLSTSATPFPYAIGLYVFAAPWAWLTADHVTLLRVVVCACEAAAGALLYPLILRAWGDRATGVTAVLLFHLLPLPYAVIGNANLTNAFGQSAALVTMTAAIGWAFQPAVPAIAGLTALASLAFLSHVGTLAFLLPTLLILAALFHVAGGPAWRRPALSVLTATGLALVIAVALYYAHFGSIYRPHIDKARAALTGASIAGAASPAPGPGPARDAAKATPLRLGVKGALDQTRGSLGWPIIVLALAGAWCLMRKRRIDRLQLGIGAWSIACALFLAWSAVRTVDPLYVQDAWEFIGRVELATSPAAAVLAACGATWAWRSGLVLRTAAGVLVAAAVGVAARALGAWIS